MSKFEQIFQDALSNALADRHGLSEEEIAQASEQVARTLFPQIAASMLVDLKRRTPSMLRKHKRDDAGFVARNYHRWKRPLDLLELLWNISEEVGAKFNETERAAAVEANDYQFEALVSLHARGLLISREVLCLLYGGFPDGALSRWRSLHETAVIAVFVQSNDQETAHRYLASFPFASLRAAKQLNKHAERANMAPFTDQELTEMTRRCEGFEGRFGQEMHNEYGWASKVLNNQKPNFTHLEKAVQLDHWRPRYRWASQHTHGGYRPPFAMLGTTESRAPVHLVGQSNSGFTDPIHMTAISLNQVTSSLLVIRPVVDNIVFLQIIGELSDEIGSAALEVETRPLTKAPKKRQLSRKSQSKKSKATSMRKKR